ncbi:MAG: hypothetical protein WCE90_01120 [Candidatus Zixiibacteriota bacterium]
MLLDIKDGVTETEFDLSLSNIIIIVAISLLFLYIGHSFILQRTPFNRTGYLAISGDTYAYVSMILGNGNNVSSPFKFRILVPFLASLLPFSPIDSLRFISYISLFFCYIFILLTCAKLGLSTNHSAIGLLAVWASTWHLYNYHNPFLTDTFGLLMLCVMIFALFNDSFFVFLTAAVLGVLARESTIFLVPVWLVKKEWKRSILLMAMTIIALLIPRHFLASATDPTLVSIFDSIGILQQPLAFAKGVFSSWGFIWFLSIIGIWYLPTDKFALVAVAYVSLLGGAIFTSLVATDTGRMFSILTPVIAITSSQLYAELINRNRVMAFTFVGLVILQALVSRPNVIFGIGSWVFGLTGIVLLVEMIYIAFVVIALGKSLPQQVRGKTKYLFVIIRKPSCEIE